MRVTPEDVRSVAALARLRLDEAELERMARELDAILGHVAELETAELETTGESLPEAAPEYDRTGGSAAALREDVPAADPLAEGPASSAPGWEAGFFTVPRLASHVDGPPERAEDGGA